MNLANKLTFLRVLMIPLFIFFLYFLPAPMLFGYFNLNTIIALLIFIIACITDAIDGYVARKYNMITDLGKLIDPLADKILVLSALVCFIQVFWIPAWTVVIIIAREFVVTGFRLAVVAKDNKAVIAADIWGKIKTAFTMGAIIAIMVFHIAWDFVFQILFNTYVNRQLLYLICDILVYICVVLTVISGITMIYKNRKLFKQ
ncbi:MAG: CDP-diacylglycerol--glycerol-3-phosphate 3-phosphatidyltransferase [Oscillospiraceae bacterium]|jgi:CDP-diacylglycerol--glycerol-3-phosphate 3-phosphatidyltransferase|nr:CDP-diacylglycerol--glycerol-3-phosphate 3-phosphatidyltransferase [Oscillospiraceae bacterium]